MKIGKIISVEYDKFRIKLFHSTKTSAINIEGQVYYFGNIGSYLKTQNPIGDTIICEVVAVVDYTNESRIFSTYNLDSSRELVIKPIGTLTKNKEFSMGIGIFPSIYSDVNIVTNNDIFSILNSHKKVNPNPNIHQEIEIGKSKNMINYRVNLNINKLFNIHTAVLGNSGSGKSNTIAHILQEVLRKKENHGNGVKTILFDVNGEYPTAFVGLDKNIQTIFYKPNFNRKNFTPFFLPYYLMNLDEWLAFLMASDRTQKPFWDKVLQECFKFYKIFNSNDDTQNKFTNYFKWKVRFILSNIISQVDSDTAKITASKGIILKCKEIILEYKEINKEYNYDELISFVEKVDENCTISFGNNEGKLSNFLSEIEVDENLALQTDSERLIQGDFFDYKFLKTAVDIVLLEEEAKGNNRIREFTSTMLSRLDYFLTNPDCNFMRDIKSQYSSVNDYLEKIFFINNNEKRQLIIIDSSEVGNDALELMTGVISRMLFDYKKSKSGNNRQKNPIHIVLDEAHRYIKKDAEYILKENIFERIAREGRKFSLYLLISSQRPSELSSTVLSQCGNYIIHRVQNEIDMRFVYSVLPYFSDDYTTRIKQQIPGEALIFGSCVPMPLHIMINEAKPAPNSQNCDISQEWYDITEKEN